MNALAEPINYFLSPKPTRPPAVNPRARRTKNATTLYYHQGEIRLLSRALLFSPSLFVVVSTFIYFEKTFYFRANKREMIWNEEHFFLCLWWKEGIHLPTHFKFVWNWRKRVDGYFVYQHVLRESMIMPFLFQSRVVSIYNTEVIGIRVDCRYCW